MIDAKEAKSISNTMNISVIAPFRKELEKLIRGKAIDGSYQCEITVPDSLRNLIGRVRHDLIALGYDAMIIYDDDRKTLNLVVEW